MRPINKKRLVNNEFFKTSYVKIQTKENTDI